MNVFTKAEPKHDDDVHDHDDDHVHEHEHVHEHVNVHDDDDVDDHGHDPGRLATGDWRLAGDSLATRDPRLATFSLDSPFDGLLLSMAIAMMKRYPNPYFWYWHKPSGGLRPLL